MTITSNIPGLPSLKVGNLYVPDVRLKFPDDPHFDVRPLGVINTIVIHHSVSKGVKSTIQAELDYLGAVYHLHHDINQWGGIGYHAVVFPSGRAYITGGVEDIRAHVLGKNFNTYGICLVGDFTDSPPGRAQLESTHQLVNEVSYGLGRALYVVGHRDLMATQCPGNTWPEWKHEVGA